jgi:hypothetical protein
MRELAASLRILCYPLLVLLIGCSKGPQTPEGLQPVSGIVRDAAGKPFAGGMIEFRRVDDSRVRSTSGVDAEGKFKLQFADANARFDGAKPGTYEVTVYAAGTMESFPSPQKVTIVPNQNTVEVSVEKAPR